MSVWFGQKIFLISFYCSFFHIFARERQKYHYIFQRTFPMFSAMFTRQLLMGWRIGELENSLFAFASHAKALRGLGRTIMKSRENVMESF